MLPNHAVFTSFYVLTPLLSNLLTLYLPFVPFTNAFLSLPSPARSPARKKQQVKQEKTLAAHAEALQAAEKKAAAQLANLRTSGPAATVSVCVFPGPQ